MQQFEEISEDTLIYPEHPFPSELCIEISKLPPGLSELALARKLSTRVIDIAVQYATWQRQVQDLRKKAQRGNDKNIPVPTGADAAVAVLECSGLQAIDRCLVVALMAYAISIDVQKVVTSSIHPYFIQTQVKMLPQLDSIPESEWDYIAWIALVLKETMGSGTSASLWANRVIRDFEKRRGSNYNWDKLQSTFFPIPAISRKTFSGATR
jgi:hypothetical protein